MLLVLFPLVSCASCYSGLFHSQLMEAPRHVMDKTAQQTLALHKDTEEFFPPIPAGASGKRLTIEDCRSVALKHNLDLAVVRMREMGLSALKRAPLPQLFPRPLFVGELSERDNRPYAYSEVMGMEGIGARPGGGEGVTNWSSSQERTKGTYCLEIRWSPNDAVVAYLAGRTACNAAAVGHFERVRAAQKLVETVDRSYYRLLAYQGCLPMARRLMEIRNRVSRKMEELQEEQLVRFEECHRAERNRIAAKRLLSRIKTGMERERALLSTAFGRPSMHGRCPIVLDGELKPPHFNGKLCDLEMTALQNRPEALVAGLNHLTSINGYRSTMVKYFPRVGLFWRHAGDKEKFLYHHDWKQIGFQVHVDLIDWLTTWSQSRAASIDTERTRRQMAAVAVSITSQVHLAAMKYLSLKEEMQNTEDSLTNQWRALRLAKKKNADGGYKKLALEQVEGDLIQEQIEWTTSLGELNASLAELHAALGTNYREPTP